MLSIFLAFLGASFVFWNRLKEEIAEEQLLAFSLFVAIFSIVGLKVSALVFGGRLFLWAGIAAGAFAGWYMVRRFGWQLWDILDGLVVALLAAVFFGGVGANFSRWNPYGLVLATLSVLVLLFGRWARGRFKNWAWYKSGKIGVVGLLQLIIFSLGVLMVASLPPLRLYWSAFLVDQVLTAAFLFVLVVCLYRRSERDLKGEFQWLKRK